MYYPKSQITPNLYTNGDEFVSSIDNSSYSGYYFKTSAGKYFTGRNQDDRPNVELIIATALSQDTNTTPNPNININVLSLDNTDFLSNQYEVNTDEVLNYFTLKNINIYDPPKTLIPTYNPILPTQQDYQNGEFRRLFAKKTNEIQYVEIDQDTFAKLLAKDPQILWQLYEPFDLTWYLTGNIEDVARINFNTVELATLRKKLPMLGEYLKFNYIKYYNKMVTTNVLVNRDTRANTTLNREQLTGSLYRDNSISR